MAGKKKVIVIGAGYGGLASAVLLAHKGFAVTLIEKNAVPGGRARLWEEKGYRFDMGPSWYLMPEAFDRFFDLIGKKREDYLPLDRLDPYYRVFFSKDEFVDIGPDMKKTKKTFASFEKGGDEKLVKYLENCRIKYDTAVGEFLYRDYSSVLDFMNPTLLLKGTKLSVFESLDSLVSKYFTDHRAKKILEYAMVFLGNSPYNAPAMYSMMSHLDLDLGVFFPRNGMWGIVEALMELCREYGVEVKLGEPVRSIEMHGKDARAVVTDKGRYEADIVLANADYAHAETDLLPDAACGLDEGYWKKKTYAPSMFIMYLGVKKRLKRLAHHTLYFAADWDHHFRQIFDDPAWPDQPSYYVSVTSKTQPDVAPKGCENVFVLVPVACNLDDNDAQRAAYADKMIAHLETLAGENIRDHIEVKRIFSGRDFTADYNARYNTALGLSHTFDQTAVFRPPRRSKKVKNLFYAGHYTHPGVGVPMVFIAAELAAKVIAGER
ncbi:MAG TPA: phytoene desaturase family protein [bacterium]|nr:phytoene desaturase family protein [bacterium]